MTVPWIFYATDSFYTALAGFLAALIAALQNRSLLTVAACACIAALVVSMVVGV
jgi:hypothetical protein